MRRVNVFAAMVLCGLIAACGGGSGGSGTGGGGGGTPPTIPTVSAIAPSATVAGAADTTIMVYGSNFKFPAMIQWNKTILTNTTSVNATTLTATIPASDLTAAGSASISVVNPDGGTSTARPFTIDAVPPSATWVKPVAGVSVIWDMAWDAAHQSLYVSLAKQDGTSPNTIVPVDPVAGTAGTPVAAGNNPHQLSISSDASYLWTSLDGDQSVQRFLLPGLTKDIAFPAPANPLGYEQSLESLEAAPVNPHTVALSSYGQNGVYVYDDATQRPNYWHQGNGPAVNSVQWGKDDSVLYGFGTYGTSLPLSVDASGVQWNGTYSSTVHLTAPIFDRKNGLEYSSHVANDPVLGTQVGQFDVPIPDLACTADDTLGRYFCVTLVDVGGADVFLVELWVFDLKTYALVSRSYVGSLLGSATTQTQSPVTGAPRKLLRWGNAGLALLTTDGAEYNVPDPSQPYGVGGLFLIDGAAVNPNAPADFTSGSAVRPYGTIQSISPQNVVAGSGDVAVTVNGSGFNRDSSVYSNWNYINQLALPTTYVSPTQLTASIPAAALASAGPLNISVLDPVTGFLGNNSMTITVSPASGNLQMKGLNQPAIAMAWDAANSVLYLGTADTNAQYPNSIVGLSGTEGSVVNSQGVNPNPDLLSVGAGGQYLYASYEWATNLDQFALPGLSRTASTVLNTTGLGSLYFAGDVKAAPVNPHAAAVALFSMASTPRGTGVAIFDDGVARPNVSAPTLQGTFVLPDTLAWSNSDQLLTAAMNENGGGPLYTFSVDPSGPAYVSTPDATFNQGGMIHSDFGNGLIYSDDGNVADPVKGTLVGSFNASGLVLPDSARNRVFILTQSASQANTQDFTLVSFDQKSFAQVSSITLSNLLGDPFALERWGSSGFAILTVNPNAFGWGGPAGMVYLVQDNGFISAATPAKSDAISSAREKMQWHPPDKWAVAAMMRRSAHPQIK